MSIKKPTIVDQNVLDLAALKRTVQERRAEARAHVHRTRDQVGHDEAVVNDRTLDVERLKVAVAEAMAAGQPARDGRLPGAQQALAEARQAAEISTTAHKAAIANDRKVAVTLEREIKATIEAEYFRTTQELEEALWDAARFNRRLQELHAVGQELLDERRTWLWPLWWAALNAETANTGSFLAGWRRFVRRDLHIVLPHREPGFGDD